MTFQCHFNSCLFDPGSTEFLSILYFLHRIKIINVFGQDKVTNVFIVQNLEISLMVAYKPSFPLT